MSNEFVFSDISYYQCNGKDRVTVLAMRKVPCSEKVLSQAISLDLDQKSGFPIGYHAIKKGKKSENLKLVSDDLKCFHDNLISLSYKKTSRNPLPKEVLSCANWDFEMDMPLIFSNYAKNALKKYSQSEWFSGAIPDPSSLAGYVGGSSVDASQLCSSFCNVNEAIQMVNSFNSRLLRDIAFIFNTTGGAYGVYVPWLDEQIKQAEVKNWLKSKGFIIDESNSDYFMAYSNDQSVTQEQIEQEIQNAQQQVKMQGGNTFGINMGKIISAARADAADSNITSQEDINDLITLHLGATMVHEAMHALGNQSEGPSEQQEQAFIQWALPIINDKRAKRAQGTDVNPLVVNPGMRRSWYDKSIANKIQKCAQSGAQFALQNSKITTDVAPWSFLLSGGGEAVENLLGVHRNGLAKQPYEMQLRLRSNEQSKINTREIIEELLEKDHDLFPAYQTIESLLEDRRPKPLAIMVRKESGNKKQIKTAVSPEWESFGWMSNLDLDFSERVKSYNQNSSYTVWGEEGEEDYSFSKKEIRQLPRYNGEFANRNGIYYFWNEPRREPELWDRMISERNAVPPAKRFAEKKEHSMFLELLALLKKDILCGKFCGSRILCSKEYLTEIDDFFSKYRGRIAVFVSPPMVSPFGSEIFPVWIVRKSVSEKAISVAEAYASGLTGSKDAEDVFCKITSLSSHKETTIKKIITRARELAKSLGIEDAFALDELPRTIILNDSFLKVSCVEFICNPIEKGLKLGSILSEEFNGNKAMFCHNSNSFAFSYAGILFKFLGKNGSKYSKKMINDLNFEPSFLNYSVLSKPFTLNMLAYDLNNKKIIDVSRRSYRDLLHEVVNTFFVSEEFLKQNPEAIISSIFYKCQYDFVLSKELKEGIKSNCKKLLSCNLDKIRYEFGKLKTLCESKVNKTVKEIGINDVFMELEKRLRR